MLTNSDCTIYSRVRGDDGEHTWNKQYVPECWWFEDTQSSITTEGLASADVLTVRIADLSVVVKKGDFIVKGNCPVDMQTVKDLADYDYFKVTKANYNTFGDSPHIRVVGA